MISRYFLCALLIVSACSKPDEYKELRSPFQLMSMDIGFRPPCSRVVPMEWSPEYPIPVIFDGKLHYRVFFRGWEGGPESTKIRDAEADALFEPSGKVVECSRRSERGRPFAPSKMPTATRDEFDSRQRALYDSIEELGRLYAKGLPVLETDRERVRKFAEEFRLLSDPGHAASYRALSPEFWAWVEKNGGAAP
jgi:hypothetical protein